jgi:hypothetical protein
MVDDLVYIMMVNDLVYIIMVDDLVYIMMVVSTGKIKHMTNGSLTT